MKIKIFKALLLFCFISYSQSNYEPGYFIANHSIKQECLILNKDWLDNPTIFKYKQSENATSEQGSIDRIKEFGINNKSKYIRFTGNIERSSSQLSNLGTKRAPIFKKETVYLRVLIEGPATLYEYADNGLVKYFFKTNDHDIEQLIKIEYYNRDGSVSTNNLFRQQLSNYLKCETISKKNLEWLEYKERSLAKIFIKYNKCKEPTKQQADNSENNQNFIEAKKLKNATMFSINAGTTLNRINVLSPDQYFIGKTDLEVGYRIGIEAEFIFPYFNNIFSFLLEPVFHTVSYSGTFPQNPESFYRLYADNTFNGNYTNFDINIGLRYKYRFNQTSAVFTNFIISKSLPKDSDKPGVILNESASKSLSYHDSFLTYYSLGFGYKLNNKFSLETRFSTNRMIANNYFTAAADLATSSLIFGYTF